MELFSPPCSRGYLEENKGYKAGEDLGWSEAGRGDREAPHTLLMGMQTSAAVV